MCEKNDTLEAQLGIEKEKTALEVRAQVAEAKLQYLEDFSTKGAFLQPAARQFNSSPAFLTPGFSSTSASSSASTTGNGE